MPAFIIGGIGAASSLLGGLFGSSASSKAAQEQIQAEQQAETYLQGQEQTGLQNYSPFLQGGQQAEGTLSNLLGTPGQGLLTPWTQQFTAPTAAQAAATPGYQFQLGQGEAAMQNSAAGQGSLLSGRTLASLNNYAQGTAASNYQNVFNNAQTQYQDAYNTFLNNQQNQYNMLSGQAGMGLSAAQGAGGLISGVGGDIASLMGQKGASAAAGTIGSANAWSSALSGASNSLSSGFLLNNLLGNQAYNALPTFNGGSVGGVSNSTLGAPSYMPGGYMSGSTPSAPYSLSSLMMSTQPQGVQPQG